MIELVLGIILLVAPFLLVNLFSDKKKGFIYVLFFLLIFQTILAILTQALGIFYYGVVIGCTLFVDVILLLVYFKIRQKSKKTPSFNLNNIDWVIIIVAIISLLSLYQVHYNYTGKINLATDQTVSYHEVKNMVYPYPYFSDEWYSVSLVNGAIDNHSLPIKNVLDNNFFFNLELFFSSFLAQIVLFFGLNPVLDYAALSLLLNALIIVLIYIFLRISNVPKLAAGIASLSALYITCGANLPGLWDLIPFNMGIVFFLMTLCLMELKNIKAVFVAIVFSSMFYPPLVLFFFTALLVFLFSETKISKMKLIKICTYISLSLLLVIPTMFVILMVSPIASMIKYASLKVFFVSYMAPLMPQIKFYDVIPIWIVVSAFFGLYYIFKNKKWILFYEIILGSIFWFTYSFSTYRFLVEYERVVVFTGIAAILASGFGLKFVELYLSNKVGKYYKILKFAEISILFVFLLAVPFYTQREGWRNIISVDASAGGVAYPKSPANNYLANDDIRIFKDINNKKFLSLPWKGTVVGVTTGNYPILSKEGTISIGSIKLLNDFVGADCVGKTTLAKNYKIDYIYLYEFNCPGFKKIAKSQEGFILYSRE